MKLGEAIKTARENKNLTQAQFAKLCGLTPPGICMIEKDQRKPSLSSLKSILSVLGLHFGQLCEIKIQEICPMCKQIKPKHMSGH